MSKKFTLEDIDWHFGICGCSPNELLQETFDKLETEEEKRDFVSALKEYYDTKAWEKFPQRRW